MAWTFGHYNVSSNNMSNLVIKELNTTRRNK